MAMINKTAFMQRFPNQWPLKALCNIVSHLPIPTHNQPCKATASSSGSSQCAASCSGTPRHTQLKRSRGSN